MLAFIKKKIGINPDTEDQCNCCNGGNKIAAEPAAPQCGCGESTKVSEIPLEPTKG